MTSRWVSTSSLSIILNRPLYPQLHREGSLNFVSTWCTEMVLPQEGHSNRAMLTCGRTSDACLTIPSMTMSFPRFSLRMFRILISWDKGRRENRRRKFVVSVICSMASSPALMTSSGWSRTISASSGSNFESSEKSATKKRLPFLTSSKRAAL